ncbi:PREDICTED: tRNA (guanine-N(7)-)-methyltransferase non-catalytic subunit WDR4 isoform X1 [Thamnophis sirtalis]|uniref:tRNA (Guanine-N(7)-)-methyltransferase non-catalytic subunit WDR4 isoform X1 n=1 Tax=Thamnophis sirtalis TaxID=35019 RepID=A0A6I9XTM1_9SAUR|nr:PREDICTED: tRNA (guanine-N(7)-)-methyltransferase non-catalytic subunit WDR4 isoform X1 [Thamnophis sirtalis]
MEAADVGVVSASPKLLICEDLMVVSGGTKFFAANYKEANNDDLFIYDCSAASKKLQEKQKSEDGKPLDKTNNILACAFSSSGKYFVLTDDNKQLILFCSKPSWKCLSIRPVMRRCTSLIITSAEDKILVADKSGDVYSYSIIEPKNAGTIELGHLSLLLNLTLSPDDQYIVTADRDEKIRVSLTKAPHVIVSFCLGHREFVSTILVLPNLPDLLLSASGDDTLRLWKYKSGKELHCFQLNNLNINEAGKNKKKYAVSRIVYCCEGNYIAILYDCIPAVSIFQLDADTQSLISKQHITLSHKGWDIAFEETGGLWVLQENQQIPLLFYQHKDGQWQPVIDKKELVKMSKYICNYWRIFEGAMDKESCFQNLYKASFDNMSIYLKKKEERLQQQKNKRKDPQYESSEQTKKVKSEELS